MNEFSILCRILGSLFNRPPQDPLLMPLFAALQDGTLQQQWPLEQDVLLARLQQDSEPLTLAADYTALFIGERCLVPPCGSAWDNGPQEGEVRDFLKRCGMSPGDAPADRFGGLLLASSWLEDHATTVANETAQLTLFNTFLLPWCDLFLTSVETHASTVFYRTLAELSREAIWAMRDELDEEQ